MADKQYFMITQGPKTQDVKVTNTVTVSDTGGNTSINEYNEDAAVVNGVETTILTYVVPASKVAKLQGIVATGSASGKFRLKVAGTTKTTIRTSTADRAKIVNFEDGTIDATAGQSVTVTALHEETANQSMEVNLTGYLVDA